jgi:hypothetical protein
MRNHLVVLVLFALSVLAPAETFRMRNGSSFQGTIKRGGGGLVIIETVNGVSTYRIIDFDDTTQAKLSLYDQPVATPQPAAPITRTGPAARTVEPKPSTSPLEAEDLVEEEGTTTTKLPKSREEFVRRVSELKGNALLVCYAGFALVIIGGLWFLVRGFQVSIWWGLALILCGIASLVFLVAHWSRAKDPFFVQLVGIALVLVALVVLS